MSSINQTLPSVNLSLAIARNPPTASPETPLGTILTQMKASPPCEDFIALNQCPLEGSGSHLCQASQINCVIGIDHEQVVGILTQRDILRICTQGGQGTELPPGDSLLSVPLGQVMTQPVVTLAESAFTELAVAIERLRHHQIRHLPIVDDNQKLVGIVTCDTLAHALLLHQLHQSGHQRMMIAEIEQRYANLVEAAPVGIFHADAQGLCTYVNERWCIITGRSPVEVLYQSWLRLVTPDDRGRVTEEIARAATKGRPFQCEFCLLRPDQSFAWVYGQMVAERSPRGDILGYVGTFTDITRHKQFETALQRSDDQSRNILSLIPDYLFRIDRQGKYLDIVTYQDNISLVTQGINPVGHTMAEVLPPKVAAWQMGYLHEALTTGQLGVYEQQVDMGDHIRWEEVRVVKSGDDEALFMVRDISDRKHAEFALQGLVEGTAAVTGQDFFPSLVRHIAAVLQADYALVSEIRGDELHTLAVWAQDKPQLNYHYKFADTPCERAIQEGVFYCESNAQGYFPADADLVTLQVQCYLGVTLQNATGTPIGVLCVLNRHYLNDPEQAKNLLRVFAARAAAELERQRATLSLQRLNQQLETKVLERTEALQTINAELARATRLKDEFLANMSHELRTPLNAILGLSEALQEGVFGALNEPQAKTLHTIETSGQHLLALINDVLDVAKIEAGKIDLHRHWVNLAELCHSSYKFVAQEALKKQIGIQIELDPHVPPLLVDERRLRQVLINLLSNAVKFTPQGGGVTITTRYYPPDSALDDAQGATQPGVHISVSDTGIGMAPDKLQLLFQPFMQIDSTLNRRYQGTGLGLVLVKRLIELHGGHVSVVSQPGKGSCFTLHLPDSAAAADGVPNCPGEYRSEQPVCSGQATAAVVLIAEDNPANMATISGYLKARNHSILQACNGHDAIAQAQAAPPDIILMDIQMPDMDGLEAIRQIRKISELAVVPIIAITDLAQPDDRYRCLEAGADRYLSKPLKLKLLATTIQELLSPSSPSPNLCASSE